METISGLTKDVVRNSDLLGQSHSLSFPYFRDWKFGFGSDMKPKVSFFLYSICRIVSGVIDFLWVFGFGLESGYLAIV
jgi:hypothetical protein